MSHAPRMTAVKRSSNRKTGPIPVTLSESSTCPDACSFKAGGCYAKGGPMAMAWRQLDANLEKTFERAVDGIRKFPLGSLWRGNTAGDLPGLNNDIDRQSLDQIIEANRGKLGFTYTHKPITLQAMRRGNASIETVRANRAAVSHANLHGFTINVSCDSVEELDGLGTALPAVVVLPSPDDPETAPKVLQSPGGRTITVCPAQYRDAVTCDTCRLCARPNRSAAVGFWAHGYATRRVNEIVSSTSVEATRPKGKTALTIVR